MLWPLLVPIGLGLAFTIAGLHGSGRARRLFRHGVRTEAVIVGQRSSFGVGEGSSTMTQAPRVEFTTGDGRRVRATSSASTSHSSFVPGRRVIVHYDPHDPTTIAIKGYDGRVERILTAIGVPLLALFTAAFLLDAGGFRFDEAVLGPLLAFGIPLLIGGVFLAIGIAGVRSVVRTRSGPRATGVVVGETTSQSSQGMTLHHPVVRWTTPDGETVEAPSTRGRVFRRHEVGQQVEVCQHPDDPRRMLLRGDGPSPVFVVFLAVGVIVLAVGLLIAGAVLSTG